MYLIGRPWMPPLALTQSKYAFATLPIVVKSTPGISMSIPPSLIGAPVAFLPLPRPHFIAAPAAADPTFAFELDAVPTATAVSSAIGSATARAILRNFIPPPPPLSLSCGFPRPGAGPGISQAGQAGCRGANPLTERAPMQDTVRHIRKRECAGGVSS